MLAAHYRQSLGKCKVQCNTSEGMHYEASVVTAIMYLTVLAMHISIWQMKGFFCAAGVSPVMKPTLVRIGLISDGLGLT